MVRDMWEGFLSNDFEASLRAFDPEVEWDGSNLPDGTVSRGLDAVMEHVSRWAEMWERWEVELEDVIDAGGDRVIAFIRERGRSKAGLEMNERHSELYRVRDGRIVYRKGFSDADEALEVAGLRVGASNPTLAQFRAAFLAGNEAFNRGDFARAFAGLAPGCEWQPVAYATERVLIGPEQVCRFFEQEIFRTFPDWRTDPVDFLQAEDGVFVVLLQGHGTGDASRAPTRLDLAELWELREGVPVRVREFPTWEEALSTAGLDPSIAADVRAARRSRTG